MRDRVWGDGDNMARVFLHPHTKVAGIIAIPLVLDTLIEGQGREIQDSQDKISSLQATVSHIKSTKSQD